MSTVQSSPALAWRKRLQLSALALIVCELTILLLAMILQHEKFSDLVWIPIGFVVLPVIGLALTIKWPRVGAVVLLFFPFFWQLVVTAGSLTGFSDKPVIIGLLLIGTAIALFGFVCVAQVLRRRRTV
jgi:hypothetical protein